MSMQLNLLDSGMNLPRTTSYSSINANKKRKFLPNTCYPLFDKLLSRDIVNHVFGFICPYYKILKLVCKQWFQYFNIQHIVDVKSTSTSNFLVEITSPRSIFSRGSLTFGGDYIKVLPPYLSLFNNVEVAAVEKGKREQN